MSLRLRAHLRIELRWWWEGTPAGDVVRFWDQEAARRYVASLCARPEVAIALRRFVHGDAAWSWSAPDDRELIDRLATAIVTGRAKIAKLPVEQLSSWDEARAEEEAPVLVAPPLVAPEPEAPVEEICWPCLRAIASARALREAASDGAPFVVQG